MTDRGVTPKASHQDVGSEIKGGGKSITLMKSFTQEGGKSVLFSEQKFVPLL